MHSHLLSRILAAGIVAVVRSPDPAPLIDAMSALLEGGVTVVEVTLTVPDALKVLRAVKAKLGDRATIGAGTVLDAESCRAAVAEGADFIVSPTVSRDVIATTRHLGKVSLPGAFSPTEILAAFEAGADIVKVFPAESLGPAFFRAIRAPLPQIPLMPTGGVDLDTAADFLRAGAVCLGLGSRLIEPTALLVRDFSRLTDLAKRYVAIVAQTRAEMHHV